MHRPTNELSSHTKTRSVWPSLQVKIARREKWASLVIFKPGESHILWNGCLWCHAVGLGWLLVLFHTHVNVVLSYRGVATGSKQNCKQASSVRKKRGEEKTKKKKKSRVYQKFGVYVSFICFTEHSKKIRWTKIRGAKAKVRRKWKVRALRCAWITVSNKKVSKL